MKNKSLLLLLCISFVGLLLYFLCKNDVKNNEQTLNELLAGSIFEGHASFLKRYGDDREPLFIFSVSFIPGEVVLEDIDGIPFSRIEDKNTQARLIDEGKRYLRETEFDGDKVIFLEGTDQSGFWMEIIASPRKALIFAHRM
jgi:hypothetical protein